MKKQIKNLRFACKPEGAPITLTHPDQVRIAKWVGMATSEDASRLAINAVDVRDEFATGTDGRSIHRAPLLLPNGFYSFEPSGKYVIAQRWDLGGMKFPDWRNAAPRLEECKLVSGSADFFAALYGKLARAGVCVDDERLKRAALRGEKHQWQRPLNWDTYVHGDKDPSCQPVILDDDETMAVVMPIRVSW